MRILDKPHLISSNGRGDLPTTPRGGPYTQQVSSCSDGSGMERCEWVVFWKGVGGLLERNEWVVFSVMLKIVGRVNGWVSDMMM